MDYRFSDRIANMTGNAIREIFKLLDRPNIISFAGGIPAPDLLPVEEVIRYSRQALEKDGKTILQYGITEGYKPLQESTAKFLEHVGIHCTANEVLIISGAQQGIDLMCKAFINKGDCVLVENPTYLAALQIMNTYEAKIIGVDTDDQGMTPEDMEKNIKLHNPKMIYLIPTFQNPSGRTFGLERRKQLVSIAAKYNVLIIEDDPYRDLRYKGEALPSMKSFDTEGNVVYLTSYSKIISPGLRVGAAVAPPAVMRKMTIGKQATDVHTSILSQAIVDTYLREGILEDHIAQLAVAYGEKLNAMLGALDAYFPSSVRFTRPEGGLFVWAELPKGVDTLPLLEKCLEKGVAYIPGTHFFADGSGQNTLRLNFSNAKAEEIERGVKILSEVFTKEI